MFTPLRPWSQSIFNAWGSPHYIFMDEYFWPYLDDVMELPEESYLEIRRQQSYPQERLGVNVIQILITVKYLVWYERFHRAKKPSAWCKMKNATETSSNARFRVRKYSTKKSLHPKFLLSLSLSLSRSLSLSLSLSFSLSLTNIYGAW